MQPIDKWHAFIASGDQTMLDELLAPECVFLSPVVHTPQEGKDVTRLYLSAAGAVLGDGFHYVKEVVDAPHAVLEFVCEVDGITINGVDIITFDDAGQIIQFKVMIRPLKAINMVHTKMREMLEQFANGKV